jgi:hypothetical protein
VPAKRISGSTGPILSDQIVVSASIAAHEQARIAAGENGLRLFGVGDQRLYAAIDRKRGAMPYPRFSGIRTVP